MGWVSTALEHHPNIWPWASFRSQLAAGGALAGAGVLVVGLVIAPPEPGGPSPEVHAVRPVNVALSSAASSVVLLDDWVRSQARNVAPVAAVVPGPADIMSAVATARRAIAVNPPDPATNSPKIDAAAVTAIVPTLDVGAILLPLLNSPITGPIVRPIVVIGGLGVFFAVVAIVGFVLTVQDEISRFVGSLPALPFLRTTSATATEVEATVTPTDPQVSDPAPATLAVQKDDVSGSVPSVDPATDSQKIDAAALIATIPKLDVDAILTPLFTNPITGPILFFGGLGVVIVVKALSKAVTYVQEAISGLVGSLPALPFLRTTAATTTEAEATATPMLSTDPTPATPTVQKTGVAPSVPSIDPPAPPKRLRSSTAEATKDLTETIVADDVSSAPPTTVGAAESVADVPISEPAKPAVRHATPRAVVRDVLGLRRQVRDQLHRPPTGEGATKGRASSVASSPATSPSTSNNSKDGGTSAGDSPSGDAGNP